MHLLRQGICSASKQSENTSRAAERRVLLSADAEFRARRLCASAARAAGTAEEKAKLLVKNGHGRFYAYILPAYRRLPYVGI
jgi:hypothetical protein